MKAIYDPDFSPGERAMVNYIDNNGRSLRSRCEVIMKQNLDGEPYYLISAPIDVVSYLGSFNHGSPNLAIVHADELDLSSPVLTVVVDNTKSIRGKINE